MYKLNGQDSFPNSNNEHYIHKTMIKIGISAGILYLLSSLYEGLLLRPVADETFIKYSLLEIYSVLGKNFDLNEQDVMYLDANNLVKIQIFA